VLAIAKEQLALVSTERCRLGGDPPIRSESAGKRGFTLSSHWGRRRDWRGSTTV